MIRSAVVTGATGGIGREIALGLARAGMRVIVIGRGRERLAEVVGWIDAGAAGAAPPAAVIEADLSSLAQTRRAAAEVLAMAPVLHVLANNAGVLSRRRTETAEGHELTLAVNHLSPFLLTDALLPALRASGAGRVVNTGSDSADHAGIDPDDLELRRGWGMVRAYARSKLALLMVSIALAERERDRGVSITVAHPGLVATGLVRTGGIEQLVWSRLLSRVALSPEAGARCSLLAALSPALAGVSGAYLKRGAVARPNRRALDPSLRARVLHRTRLLAGAA